MQNKVLKLSVIFLVLFSLRGFAQDTEKSEHPLLDKYYPQKKAVDTNKAISTQINPVTAAKPLPENKLAPVARPAPDTKVISDTKPAPAEPEMKPVPAVSQTKPVPPVTDTTAVNKPTIPAVVAPVQKKPAAPPYNENRLGSSTPQYDTWEKNNNGAGAVTTSPK